MCMLITELAMACGSHVTHVNPIDFIIILFISVLVYSDITMT